MIDNDYAAGEFPGYPDRLDPARATVAHEFNHLLQDRYDTFQDLWMFESTATWMEEKVFPAVDDYLMFLPSFAVTPGIPITEGLGQRIYGVAVWNHWLESGYGPDVIRRAWEVSDRTKPRDFAIEAYARAIFDLGGHGFSREFTRFAAATAEWRTGHGGFPDASRYPDMRRKGSLEPRDPRRSGFASTTPPTGCSASSPPRRPGCGCACAPKEAFEPGSRSSLAGEAR